jgi:hypothetical protein
MANGGIIGPVNDPVVGNTSATTESFTSSGTFTSQTGQTSADYLVVGGGGSGSFAFWLGTQGGGGGAGGFITGTCFSVSPATNYPIVIGAGGGGGPATPNPGNPSSFVKNPGSPSSFSTITSAGGGAGAAYTGTGDSGGSGGGGGSSNGSPGAGNSPPVSPPQGSNGGIGDGAYAAVVDQVELVVQLVSGGTGGATASSISGSNLCWWRRWRWSFFWRFCRFWWWWSRRVRWI